MAPFGAVWWMKEHRQSAGRPDVNSATRTAELLKEGPTRVCALQLFNSSRAKLDKANYVQARAPELADQVHFPLLQNPLYFIQVRWSPQTNLYGRARL